MSSLGLQPMVKRFNGQTMNSHGFQPMVERFKYDSLPPRNLFGIQSQMREVEWVILLEYMIFLITEFAVYPRRRHGQERLRQRRERRRYEERV